MKPLRLTLLSAAALAMLTACNNASNSLDYLPAKADGDDAWGLIDAKGKFLFQNEFEREISPAVNGYFIAEEADGYSVYKASEKPRPVNGLENLKDVGLMSEGVIPVVRPDSRIEFAGTDGKTKFTLDPVDGHEIVFSMGIFIDGRALISTDEGKWGAIDSKGKICVDPVWDEANPFNEGVAIVGRKKNDQMRYAIIDRDGKILTELSDRFNPREGVFIDGYSAGYMEKDSGRTPCLIDREGEIYRITSQAERIRMWNGKYVVFEDSEYKEGICDLDGNVIVRAKYTTITMLPGNKFIGQRNNRTYLINSDGDEEALDERLYSIISMPALWNRILKNNFMLMTDRDDWGDSFYNYSGEKLDMKKLEAIRSSLSIPTVDSDYFDVEACTAAFASQVSDNGFLNYTIGDSPKQFLEEPYNQYRYDQSATMENLPDTNYYTLSGRYGTNVDLVYDATPTAYYYTWEPNPQARITNVNVHIYPPKSAGRLLQPFANVIKRLGYEETAHGADYVELTKGSLKVTLSDLDDNIYYQLQTIN